MGTAAKDSFSKMETLGYVNERQILYLSPQREANWADQLPTANWLVACIGNEGDVADLSGIVRECLKRNVLYVCALGEASATIDLAFDMAIVQTALQDNQFIDSPDAFEYSPVTTSVKNIVEGFWFATSVAFHETLDIQQVVCLDLTAQGEKETLHRLVHKLNSGWLPDDNEI